MSDARDFCERIYKHAFRRTELGLKAPAKAVQKTIIECARNQMRMSHIIGRGFSFLIAHRQFICLISHKVNEIVLLLRYRRSLVLQITEFFVEP